MYIQLAYLIEQSNNVQKVCSTIRRFSKVSRTLELELPVHFASFYPREGETPLGLHHYVTDFVAHFELAQVDVPANLDFTNCQLLSFHTKSGYFSFLLLC